MFRIVLVLAVLAIGFDAVVHQGLYTRNVWTNLVSLTDSAVNGAKRLTESAREENRATPPEPVQPRGSTGN